MLFRSDPSNRWLARGARVRLSAEMIRDQALATSGLLCEQTGGPSVFPYQPPGLWQEISYDPNEFTAQAYRQDHGAKLYRRSLYTFWKRTVPPPSMSAFDAPGREFCVVRRSRTNTPLQAFVLLHDPQFVEAARHLGQRMMKQGGNTIDDRIVYGFRLVTARTPNPDELSLLRDAYAIELKRCVNNQEETLKVLQVGESSFDPQLNKTQLAAFSSVARLIMNLNEAITKG